MFNVSFESSSNVEFSAHELKLKLKLEIIIRRHKTCQRTNWTRFSQHQRESNVEQEHHRYLVERDLRCLKAVLVNVAWSQIRTKHGMTMKTKKERSMHFDYIGEWNKLRHEMIDLRKYIYFKFNLKTAREYEAGTRCNTTSMPSSCNNDGGNAFAITDSRMRLSSYWEKDVWEMSQWKWEKEKRKRKRKRKKNCILPTLNDW